MFNSISKIVAISVLIGANFITPAIADNGTEEVLLGVNLTEKYLELHVASNGCTSENDFSIDVNTGITGAEPLHLTVLRIKPDECKAEVPDGVTIKFSREKYKLNGYYAMTLVNKIGTTSQGR